MSAATSAVSGSISRSGDFSSSGTTIPTDVSLASARRATIKTPGRAGKARGRASRARARKARDVIELVRTNDLVLISFSRRC